MAAQTAAARETGAHSSWARHSAPPGGPRQPPAVATGHAACTLEAVVEGGSTPLRAAAGEFPGPPGRAREQDADVAESETTSAFDQERGYACEMITKLNGQLAKSEATAARGQTRAFQQARRYASAKITELNAKTADSERHASQKVSKQNAQTAESESETTPASDQAQRCASENTMELHAHMAEPDATPTFEQIWG
ncbi:unnamed protein product [Prorocentrum cordatum]|uniref:Uncharacterized protein n=1 Tax=Prorocentrum cordatum TaxID=2364126 RepID=A0ABN9YAT4_9DINO|nr:unnamed protein product [Polarella glacialis]